MPLPMSVAESNFSFDALKSYTLDSKYCAGELMLGEDGALTKINSHVSKVRAKQNNVTTEAAQNLQVRAAVIGCMMEHYAPENGQDQSEVATRVLKKIYGEECRQIDVPVREGSKRTRKQWTSSCNEILSRDEVSYVLSKIDSLITASGGVNGVIAKEKEVLKAIKEDVETIRKIKKEGVNDSNRAEAQRLLHSVKAKGFFSGSAAIMNPSANYRDFSQKHPEPIKKPKTSDSGYTPQSMRGEVFEETPGTPLPNEVFENTPGTPLPNGVFEETPGNTIQIEPGEIKNGGTTDGNEVRTGSGDAVTYDPEQPVTTSNPKFTEDSFGKKCGDWFEKNVELDGQFKAKANLKPQRFKCFKYLLFAMFNGKDLSTYKTRQQLSGAVQKKLWDTFDTYMTAVERGTDASRSLSEKAKSDLPQLFKFRLCAMDKKDSFYVKTSEDDVDGELAMQDFESKVTSNEMEQEFRAALTKLLFSNKVPPAAGPKNRPGPNVRSGRSNPILIEPKKVYYTYFAADGTMMISPDESDRNVANNQIQAHHNKQRMTDLNWKNYPPKSAEEAFRRTFSSLPPQLAMQFDVCNKPWLQQDPSLAYQRMYYKLALKWLEQGDGYGLVQRQEFTQRVPDHFKAFGKVLSDIKADLSARAELDFDNELMEEVFDEFIKSKSKDKCNFRYMCGMTDDDFTVSAYRANKNLGMSFKEEFYKFADGYTRKNHPETYGKRKVF